MANTITTQSPAPQPAHSAQVQDYRRSAHPAFAYILWFIGIILLATASVIVHGHPGPWPFDLQTTIDVQAHTPAIAVAWSNFISLLNDPIASTGELIAWLVILSLVGLIFHRRGRMGGLWVWTGVCIAAGTAAMDGLDGLLSLIVGRPRPSSPLIHVFAPEPFHSFPSGHVENDLVYYGFLLYLSFTGPVRRWRYRWILIPFQILAALVILTIAYSRIYEGSHWLTDTLGGYISGAVFLALLIFIYRWGARKILERRNRKATGQAATA